MKSLTFILIVLFAFYLIPMPALAQASEQTLSLQAQELVKLLKQEPNIEHIADIKKQLASSNIPRDSAQQIILRLELLELKQDLSKNILETGFAVDSALTSIDQEREEYAKELIALINKRNRGIMYTDIMCAVSNASLWATGEAIGIPSYAHPKLAIPSGVLGVVAGVVPSYLMLAAIYKQVHGPHEELNTAPNQLARIFSSTRITGNNLPEIVCSYLNAVPPGSNKTRKERLMDSWFDKTYGQFGSKQYEKRVGTLTGTLANPHAFTIELLTTRQTMLTDLKVMILQMKSALMELSDLL